MSDISRITINDLTGDQRQLADLIGLDNYLNIVQMYGGTSIYIRKLDTLLQNDRNREIYSKFTGYNFRELAQEYNLSERAIRDIVADIMQEVRARPIANQVAFDGWK